MYSSDKEGIAFRRILLVGLTGEFQDTERLYESFLREYPEGKCAEMARLFMEQLSRKNQ